MPLLCLLRQQPQLGGFEGAFKKCSVLLTGYREETVQAAPGCSPPRGSQGTRAAHVSEYGARTEGLEPHSSPVLHLMARPSQVIGKRALLGLGGPSEDQTLLPQWGCMQCWQHALWGKELRIQPSTPIYHRSPSPLRGGLQFRCQVW